MKVFYGDCSSLPLLVSWNHRLADVIGKGQLHSSLDTHQNGTCCFCCPVWPVRHKACSCSLICVHVSWRRVCFACSLQRQRQRPFHHSHNPSSIQADFIMPFVLAIAAWGNCSRSGAICALSASLIYGLYLFIYILFSSCFYYFYMISSRT